MAMKTMFFFLFFLIVFIMVDDVDDMSPLLHACLPAVSRSGIYSLNAPISSFCSA